MPSQFCPCTSRHSPPITAAEVDVHHAPPKSWPLAPGGTRKVVSICATTHRRCHRLLNLYVHAGGTPALEVIKGFRPIERELAAYSWDNADHSGPGHLPYTLDSGETPDG